MLAFHTATNGSVWAAGDAAQPSLLSYNVTAFLLGLGLHHFHPRAVWVLGTAVNAELIVRLYTYLQRHALAPFYVATPRLLHSSEEREDPALTLACLARLGRQCSRTSGHVLAAQDVHSYAIAWALQAAYQPELEKHPAWPALSFLAPQCEQQVALWLAHVLDPRWFTHPRRPGRLTPLFSYLGLDPASAHYHVMQRPSHTARDQRAELTYQLSSAPVSLGLWGGKPSWIPSQLCLDRAKRFTRFVTLAWEHALGALPEACFEPVRLPGTEGAAAYHAHCVRLEKA